MKNYLVVGGSSGIGKKTVEMLAGQGHQIWATYHQHQVHATKGNIQYHPLNVLDDDLKLDYLPESLDGLVYCPGSINLKPFSRIKPQQFVDDFKLQVEGAVKVIQAALPRLKGQQQASIVMFSTVAVQTGFNFHSQVSASKGAIEGLTRALAAELAPRIRVNCIAPSLTNTPLAAKLLSSDDKVEANAKRHPLQRVGQPEDLASMVAFLLSEESSWITGQIMAVDGGMSSVRN